MLDIPDYRSEAGAIAVLSRLLRDYGSEHKWAYAASALMLAIVAGTNVLAAALLRPVLNGMATAARFSEMRMLAFAVLGLFVLRGLATYGSLVVLSRTGNRIVAAVQSRVFDQLLRQNLLYFQDRHSSEFIARLALAANGVRDSLQVLAQGIARDSLSVAGLVAVMIWRDPLIAFMALCVLPVAALILGRVIRRVRAFARRSFDGSTQIMQTMSETVFGMRIVKAFNLEDMMRKRMDAAVRVVERSANRMAAGGALATLMADSLAGLAIGFAIFYGSWRVSIGHGDVGAFVSFLGALLLAYEPAKRLGRLNVDIQNGLVGARLIYEVLDAPQGEAPQPGCAKLTVERGRVVIEDARFAFRPGEYVIDDLNLVAEPNSTTALVGPSGGGKTTILGLIQRFYALSHGRVTIDGQDISAVDLPSLRDKIAFVSQDVFLFRGSIRENIAVGRTGATEAEIVAAARKAHAHDFILQFAAGYETNVGEQGAQLSGGQRQRIAIARAILKDAPILLLDEPTAALDSESEREVQKALDDLRQGRTTLVVAHRLQTIVGSNRIWVIEGGRAVETGEHQELIARRGAYYAFFAAQFGARAALPIA
ncbi:MAG TPA: ABC transporter ATP-binding protein [Roseiarcus sp.]|jgi:subfamily B ATP-binding cassette protein MsbA